MATRNPPAESQAAPRTADHGSGALQAVAHRFEFYRDGYYRLLRLLRYSAVAIAVLTIALGAALAMRPEPKYFAHGPLGLIPLIPLDRPTMSKDEIAAWASTAVVRSFSFDFVNYRVSFAEARRAFTDAGWQGFVTALEKSKVWEGVLANKLTVSAVPRSVPAIHEPQIIGGTLTYTVEILLALTYQSSSEVTTQTVSVQVTVIRTPTTERPNGVAIRTFNARLSS